MKEDLTGVVVDIKEEKVIIKDPYEGITFTKRKAEIYNSKGEIIFDEDVEFPDYFDEAGVKIVSSKYLCNDAKKKETSVKEMINRVSNTISDWGKTDGYFKDNQKYEDFKYYLKYYQIHQYFTFNSPVYFNVGLSSNPQGSACFILSIEDDMADIYENIKLESVIFKNGSGSGSNLSSLRSSKETVRGGGQASGPVSFLKAADTSAGVIRSGGTLRRSAKLSCLNDTHPDIKDFIHCKEREEKKLRILKNAGLEPEVGHDMSDEVFFQNTNISVRLSDDFMKAVEQDNSWWTKYVLTGEKCEKFKAKELLEEISDLAWKTADPGVQFSDNINKWNTCTESGSIEASNPCSEFMFLNFTSCNLAAINLRKFFYKNKQGKIIFDLESYKNIIKVIITAQDILVSNSSYPSKKITKNAHIFRPLGLGYSNIGSLLMWLGIPYDSNDGRTIASLLTALLTGIAYKQSKYIAKIKGAFEKFEENKESFYRVLKQHYSYKQTLKNSILPLLSKNASLMDQISKGVVSTWEDIIKAVNNNEGFRNAQVTLLAPTGTTSFMMGCDTFGIEPDYSLVKYKTLSGNDGAVIKTVNNTVKDALKNLEYSEYDVGRIIEELYSVGHIENNEILKKEHISIFDTATIPNGGSRYIDYMAHIKMLEAVQPFLSGAISKTINIPKDATVNDIYNLYLEAWKRGLKGVTVYRDGSKTYQPLRSSEESKPILNKKCRNYTPFKMRMPENREAEIHKFSIGNIEGYIILGKYPSGKLGEVFLSVSKQGSTLSGFLDSLGIMISTGLQYGVPLKVIVSKLIFSKFEPSGITKNENIRFTTSIVDYLAKYLGYKFLNEDELLELGLVKFKNINKTEENHRYITINDNVKGEDSVVVNEDNISTLCGVCGSLMVRIGTCYNCSNCGANSGACG